MKLCLVCNFHFSDEQEQCPKDNSPLVPISADPLIGLLIQDKYKIESVIGRGTMGVVYKATQELIGREVAVKILHGHLVADTESLKRFHQQAKAASRLNHPHIITLYDYGIIAGGQPYIVMDLLKGTSLATLLDEKGNLTADEAFPIFVQICDALADAHKHGVVHRDVKPDNIVLEEHNNQKHWVKVVDFGIAKLVQGSEETLTRITKTGTVCGSPTYMSPEQFQGKEVDHRSDIYSLGAVLFETLTGRVPFTAVDLVSLMAQHVAEPAPSLSEVRPDMEFPPRLEKLVARMLAKEPEARPQTMEAVADELEAAIKDKSQPLPQRVATTASELPAAVPRKDTKEPEPVSPAALKDVVSGQLAARGEPPKLFPATGQAATQKMARSRAAVPFYLRLVGLVQSFFPWLLTLALLAGLAWLVSNDAKVSAVLEQQFGVLLGRSGADTGQDARVLVEQGKLAMARAALEKKAAKQPLSKNETELLNSIYIRLAEQEAGARHYQNAVALLQKVSSKSSQAGKAKALLKKYRRLAR
ncbi:MAG TPA: serine/threonine-protein kinase [Candidatus Obscuribacterales bacterium]